MKRQSNSHSLALIKTIFALFEIVESGLELGR